MSTRLRPKKKGEPIKPIIGCSDCLLNRIRIAPKRGKSDIKFLFVTKPATTRALDDRAHLTHDASFLMRGLMKKHGFDAAEIAITASVECHFDPDTTESKDAKKIKSQCALRLHELIQKYNPEVVIPMGAEAASAVMGRGVKITKARGVLVDYPKDPHIKVYPLLDPDFVSMYTQHKPTMQADIAMLRKIIDRDYDLQSVEEETSVPFKIVEDLDEVISGHRDGRLLSFDTETIGTRWAAEGADIVCMQFAWEGDDTVYFLPWSHSEYTLSKRQKSKVKKQLRHLFEGLDVQLIGQNLKFDLVWVYYHLGIRGRCRHDTLLIAALLDENDTEKNLDSLTRRHVPELAGYADAFNAEFDKSRMDLVPIQRLVRYACGDVIAAQKVFEVMYPDLEKDEKLLRIYDYITVPAVNTFVPIEARGRLIAEDRLDDFEEVMAASVEEQRKSLMAQIPRSVKRAHINKGLKFSRKDFVVDILFTHPAGFNLTPKVFTKKTAKYQEDRRVPSTSSKDHLPFFFDECPFTMELAQYVKDERLLNSSIRKFRENYLIDGRIYPSYSFWTAVTGRTASRDPNAQNFPNKGATGYAYGRTFPAPEGYVIVQADLSQAEIRIAAIIANDPVLLRLYRAGADVHSITAMAVLGYSEEEWAALPKADRKRFRQAAKAVNFGYLYGMWWRKFKSYAKTQYGTDFTDREAERARQVFFELYPSLGDWHETMRRLVHRFGYVRSPLGRIRHLPMVHSPEEYIVQEAERQAINSPVQGMASDLGLLAMNCIDADIDPQYLQLCGFVHDAIYAYVPVEYADWGARVLKRYMQELPLKDLFDLELPIPIVSDIAIGYDLGDKVELEGFSLDEPFDYSETGLDLPPQLVPPNEGLLLG
jgi:uracil-DNA glycosylase family 4